jgi:hypothetical protein
MAGFSRVLDAITERQIPSRLSADLTRTLNTGLASGMASAARIGSQVRRQGTSARNRFDALPSPLRAAVFSCLLGGTGQIHLGQTKKGALIICLAVVGLWPIVVPGVVVILLGVYDAYVIGSRLQSHGKIGEWEFFWHTAVGASWKVVRVEPLGISEHFLGVETLRIDNREGDRPVTRSLKIMKEWLQSYVIEHEKAQTTTKQFEPTVTRSVMVKRTVENLYREKYSYSESRKQALEEHVTVEVPPHASVWVELRWKNILDNWILVVGNDLGEQVRVPVHVVTKLSFDQRTLNADASPT